MPELPPRARRIPCRNALPWLVRGTTSACAENTANLSPTDGSLRNYLRVRGEYLKTCLALGLSMELPPRARRIPLTILPRNDKYGTTSACAENTIFGVSQHRLLAELPPRARRILSYDSPRCLYIGTTSACAENTMADAYNHSAWRNYLRVRGEYQFRSPALTLFRELPPRARRIRGTTCF